MSFQETRWSIKEQTTFFFFSNYVLKDWVDPLSQVKHAFHEGSRCELNL